MPYSLCLYTKEPTKWESIDNIDYEYTSIPNKKKAVYYKTIYNLVFSYTYT